MADAEGHLVVRHLFWIILAVLSLAWPLRSATAAAESEAMSFKLIPPIRTPLDHSEMYYIYASGVIDHDAAARLEALVAAAKVPPASLLFLDSPGGNLLGGIDLGRVIRQSGLYTYVNAADGMTQFGTPASKPAICASACTLAFLGGRFRYIDEKSVYAVHRFYFPQDNAGAADAAQILSSAIVQYMRDMGVDPQLFTLSTKAGREDVIVPTRHQLVALNVVNNGEEKPVWSIEAIPQGLYLRGEHITIFGDNKIALRRLVPADDTRLDAEQRSHLALPIANQPCRRNHQHALDEPTG